MIVTKERKYLFIHKVALENTQQKTSHVENSRLFVKKVFTRVAKYLNTIASILRKIWWHICPWTLSVPRGSLPSSVID